MKSIPIIEIALNQYGSAVEKRFMNVEVTVNIKGPKSAVWAAITDIENAPKFINGIMSVEILEKPASGLVGLKWRETRMLFGKPASADKWITEVVDKQFYKTKAEDNGFIFISTMSIAGTDGDVTLSSLHDSLPQTFMSKVMAIPMKLFFKGVAKKALIKDLIDIKAFVEKQ